MGLRDFLKENFDKAKGLATAGVAATALTVGMSEAVKAEAAPMQLYFAGTLDAVPASFAGSGLQAGDRWSFTGTSNDPTDYAASGGHGSYLVEDITVELGSDIHLAYSISNLSTGGSIGVLTSSSWLASTEGDLMGQVFNGGSLAFLNPSPAYDPDSLTSVFNTLTQGSFSAQKFVVSFVGGDSNTIYGTIHTIDISPVSVPEPSSFALAGAGLAAAGAGAFIRRRNQHGEAAPANDR